MTMKQIKLLQIGKSGLKICQSLSKRYASEISININQCCDVKLIKQVLILSSASWQKCLVFALLTTSVFFTIVVVTSKGYGKKLKRIGSLFQRKDVLSNYLNVMVSLSCYHD